MSSKKIAALLALLMVCSFVAGCGGEKAPASDTTAPVETTDTTAAPTGLEGYAFTLANPGRDWSDDPQTALQEEMMEQYAELEAELCCTIDAVRYNDLRELLMTASMSGDTLADFVHVGQDGWGPAYVAGFIRPLDDPAIAATGLDVTNPEVCDVYYTRASTMNDRIWGVAFSGKYSVMSFGHVYCFNKRLLASVGKTADELYASVRDFTWTWDAFNELARAISDDTDGDGAYNIYGLNEAYSTPEIATNNIDMMYYEDGRWLSGFNRPELQKAVEWFVSVYMDPDIMADAREDFDREGLFYSGISGFG